MIVDVVDSFDRLKTKSSQIHYLQSLVKTENWPRLEEELSFAGLISPLATFEALSDEGPSNPIFLIILAKRAGLSDLLIPYLYENYSPILSSAYIYYICPMDVVFLVDTLLSNDQKIEEFLKNASFLPIECQIRCAEHLVANGKWALLHGWAYQDKKIFADCPILSTVLAESLLQHRFKVSDILSLPLADFNHLSKVSSSINSKIGAAICSWQKGDFDAALNILVAENNIDELLEIIFDSTGKSFSLLWNDETAVTFIVQKINADRMINYLTSQLRQERATFIANLASFPGAGIIKQYLWESAQSLEINHISERTATDLLLFFAVHDLSFAEKFAERIDNPPLVSKCVYILRDMGYTRQSGYLACSFDNVGLGIDLILKSGEDLEKVIAIVQKRNVESGWKALGEYLIKNQIFECSQIHNAIVRGNAVVDESLFSVLFEKIPLKNRLDLIKHLWVSQKQTESSLSIFLTYAPQNDESYEWAINNCSDSQLLTRIGKYCFVNKFYVSAHKAFMTVKSVDWTVLSLVELDRFEEIPKFLRHVSNSFVLIYVLEKTLNSRETNTTKRLRNLLVSALQQYGEHHVLLIDMLRQFGKLELLIERSVHNMWSDDSINFLTESLIISGLLNLGSFADKSASALFKLECWSQIDAELLLKEDTKTIQQALSNGCVYFTQDFFNSLVRNETLHDYISGIYPNLIVESNLPLYQSYWTVRHHAKQNEKFQIPAKEVIKHKDYSLIKKIADYGHILEEPINVEATDIPMKVLMARIHIVQIYHLILGHQAIFTGSQLFS